MALYLYLDNVVQDAVDESLVEDIAVLGCPSYEGLDIKFDGDRRLFYQVKEEAAPCATLVPPPLVGHVVSVSWQLRFPANSRTRVPGRYVFETAEAVLEPEVNGRWKARIHGPDIGHVYELKLQLQGGTALQKEAWPDVEPPPEDTDLNCPHCNTAYRVRTAYVAGKKVRIICKRCGKDILLDDGAVDPSESSDPEPRRDMVAFLAETLVEAAALRDELKALQQDAEADAEPPQPVAEDDADKTSLRCPHCQTRYRVVTEKIAGKKVRIACKRCDKEILLDDGVVIPPKSPEPPDGTSGARLRLIKGKPDTTKN